MIIDNIQVVKGAGTVFVYFYTDLPSVFAPFEERGFFMKAEMNSNFFEAYLAEHFPGIPVTIVN